jgi:hypothetical protein
MSNGTFSNIQTLDISSPDNVEVEIQYQLGRPVLYVHVDGITVLRICRMSEAKVVINNRRRWYHPKPAPDSLDL